MLDKFNFFDILLPQMLYMFFYYFIGFLMLITALFLITTESSVHGILYLLLIFLLLTELAIFLKMEFLGLIFIIIYIGAVCVLMLFHIKLIKTFVHRNNEIHNKNLFMPILVLCLLLPFIQIITLSSEHKTYLNKKDNLFKTDVDMETLKNGLYKMFNKYVEYSKHVKANNLYNDVRITAEGKLPLVYQPTTVKLKPSFKFKDAIDPENIFEFKTMNLNFLQEIAYKTSLNNIALNKDIIMDIIMELRCVEDTFRIYCDTREILTATKFINTPADEIMKFSKKIEDIFSNSNENIKDISDFFIKFCFNSTKVSGKPDIEVILSSDYTVWVDLVESENTTKIFGVLLFTIFFFHLIIGSLILLLTMVSTITLSLTKKREKKKQNLSDQIFSEMKTVFLKKENKKENKKNK